jgi:hypothetical protein
LYNSPAVKKSRSSFVSFRGLGCALFGGLFFATFVLNGLLV